MKYALIVVAFVLGWAGMMYVGGVIVEARNKIEGAHAARQAEHSATKPEREKLFRSFRECVRNGETVRNCLESYD